VLNDQILRPGRRRRVVSSQPPIAGRVSSAHARVDESLSNLLAANGRLEVAGVERQVEHTVVGLKGVRLSGSKADGLCVGVVALFAAGVADLTAKC
jgi:hypothetical protein